MRVRRSDGREDQSAMAQRVERFHSFREERLGVKLNVYCERVNGTLK
jgi:hypothetical protein